MSSMFELVEKDQNGNVVKRKMFSHKRDAAFAQGLNHDKQNQLKHSVEIIEHKYDDGIE